MSPNESLLPGRSNRLLRGWSAYLQALLDKGYTNRTAHAMLVQAGVPVSLAVVARELKSLRNPNKSTLNNKTDTVVQAPSPMASDAPQSTKVGDSDAPEVPPKFDRARIDAFFVNHHHDPLWDKLGIKK